MTFSLAIPQHVFARTLSVTLGALSVFSLNAAEFIAMPEMLPTYNQAQVERFAPVFDFDGDGCYPATPFDQNNQYAANPGLNIGGTVTGDCHDSDWKNYANTVHRQLCKSVNNASQQTEYCAHLYELYFEKDQVFWLFGGHKHDVETAIVWTTKVTLLGVTTEQIHSVSTSAHGDYDTRPFSDVQEQNGHPKVVYHKDGILTHAFRFAKGGKNGYEPAEHMGNIAGQFVTPAIISYYAATRLPNASESSRYTDNQRFRDQLRNASFGSATFKTRNDSQLISNTNAAKPSGWPTYTQVDADTTSQAVLSAQYPSITF